MVGLGFEQALNSITTKLKDRKASLLKALRKESIRIAKEFDFSSGSADLDWVIVQRDKKGTFSGVLQKLQNRVSEFAEQTKALTLWEALNNQLRSTDALCSKVAESEPAQKQVLSQLVTEVKEWFATESWDPLFRSSEFSERLGKVQSDVHGLLYSYTQTFNTELAEIRKQFNSLLPSTPVPMFDISVPDKQQNDSIRASFQKLYQWALEGFRAVLPNAKS